MIGIRDPGQAWNRRRSIAVLGGLRDLYEMARKRGALGVTTVARRAFINISTEEAGKCLPHHYRRPAPGRAPWRERRARRQERHRQNVSQLWTLKPTATFSSTLEAEIWLSRAGPATRSAPRTWQECRDFAVHRRAEPALRDDQPIAKPTSMLCVRASAIRPCWRNYDTVFVDSITVAGRLCL